MVRFRVMVSFMVRVGVGIVLYSESPHYNQVCILPVPRIKCGPQCGAVRVHILPVPEKRITILKKYAIIPKFGTSQKPNNIITITYMYYACHSFKTTRFTKSYGLGRNVV